MKGNNMKKIAVILVLILFVNISSQDKKFNSFFLSGNLGIHKNANTFNSGNNSTNVAFGLGFGIPIVKNLVFYNKITYRAQSDFRGYEEVQFNTSQVSLSQELVLINASFSQLILNSGLQYNLKVTRDLRLGFNGGLTYSIIDHEANFQDGTIYQRLNNEGVYGYFIGGSIEKDFEESDLTAFAEVQYNNIEPTAIYYRNRFSGVNLTIGGRYYFTN